MSVARGLMALAQALRPPAAWNRIDGPRPAMNPTFDEEASPRRERGRERLERQRKQLLVVEIGADQGIIAGDQPSKNAERLARVAPSS
jgi:hypothetical protein